MGSLTIGSPIGRIAGQHAGLVVAETWERIVRQSHLTSVSGRSGEGQLKEFALRVNRPSDTPEPVVIPYRELSATALRGLVELFVLREGTEYGPEDVPLEVKCAQVMRQLEQGQARIVFDPDSESTDIEVVRAGGGRGK